MYTIPMINDGSRLLDLIYYSESLQHAKKKILRKLSPILARVLRKLRHSFPRSKNFKEYCFEWAPNQLPTREAHISRTSPCYHQVSIKKDLCVLLLNVFIGFVWLSKQILGSFLKYLVFVIAMLYVLYKVGAHAFTDFSIKFMYKVLNVQNFKNKKITYDMEVTFHPYQS